MWILTICIDNRYKYLDTFYSSDHDVTVVPSHPTNTRPIFIIFFPQSQMLHATFMLAVPISTTSFKRKDEAENNVKLNYSQL